MLILPFLWLIPAAIATFLAVILIRAAAFRPEKEAPVLEEDIALDEEKIVADFRDMIRCKTVSDRNEALVDWAEFARFEALLAERFPLVHEKMNKKKLGKTGLLFHLAGRSSAEPTVLMSHYDVVPVEEEGWEKPAFEAILEDGVIWGRGTLDTKATLCGVLESVERALAEGYVPENDLYLSFSGEEEIDGDSCRFIVSYLEAQGVTPALVLDQGCAVVDHVFPGVHRPSAMVGIAEKGGLSVEFSIASEGGHASTPPAHTILGQLCRAVTRIEGKPFPCQLSEPTRKMFDTLGRHSTFLYRVIFANLWCFRPILDAMAKKSGGDMNALLRTTVAVTRMEGSRAYNVLPPKATLGMNLRLLGHDTMESACQRLTKLADNDKMSLRVVSGMNPSITSSTDCGGWEKVKAAIHNTWSDAIVTPYLMMACSDSRHYCRITDKVYRFSAMYLTKEERATIHGHNERIPVQTLLKTVEFYTRLLRSI